MLIAFHKKAICALLLFGFALFTIYSVFAGAAWHYNVHSGLSPIHYKLPAFFSMGSVTLYTVMLVLAIGYVKTFQMQKAR
ncbi:hypothetical protein HNO89_000910 [Sporosarcina luteola]|nr:hypothetical protein [Sporosarcina luteola]